MPARKKYFVVLDDDSSVAPIIEKSVGVETVAFPSIEALESKIKELSPEAAFVDVHLSPEVLGLEALPRLREAWPHTPIFVITSDTSEEFLARALETGADDYIRKPLNPIEVRSRVTKRLSDKRTLEDKQIVTFGNCKIDRTNRKLSGPAGLEYLSTTEVTLLLLFIASGERLIDREELKKKGWQGIAVSTAAIEKKVFDLRKHLASVGSNRTIVTQYRRGYALKPKTDADTTPLPKVAQRE